MAVSMADLLVAGAYTQIPKDPDKLDPLETNLTSLSELAETRIAFPMPLARSPSTTFHARSSSKGSQELPPLARRASRITEGLGVLNVTDSRASSPGLTPRSEELCRSVSPPQDVQKVAHNHIFMGIVHDSKNELVSNVGYTNEILDMIAHSETTGTPLDVSQLKLLVQGAGKCAIAALEIFQETLLLGKSGAGKLELVKLPFPIKELEESILATAGLTASKKELTLKFSYNGLSSEDFYIGDAGKIKQALKNLVLNAINFTEKGGVEVSIKKAKDSALLQFQVQDTGPGMSVEDQAKLFKPFSQGGSSTSKAKGSGLGLLNSAMLIQMMNNENPPIRFESVETQGTIFEFNLPLEKALDLEPPSTTLRTTTEVAAVAESTQPEPFDLKIMIVDDQLGNRSFLQRLIKKAGVNQEDIMHCETADDLLKRIGIKIVGQSPPTSELELPPAPSAASDVQRPTPQLPDLIFLDVAMPGTPGDAAAGMIRDFQTKNAPNQIVALVCTSANPPSIESPFDDSFEKGGKFDYLQGILNRAQTKKNLARNS